MAHGIEDVRAMNAEELRELRRCIDPDPRRSPDWSRDEATGLLDSYESLASEHAALLEAVERLMRSMRLWGAEEDGIPDDATTGAWAAYAHAKCVLCPARMDYKCSEYDEQYASICEPCAACGKIRKHNFASFFMQAADGKMVVVCGDVCARRYPDTLKSQLSEEA